MNLSDYKINQIEVDEFNRTSGVFAVNKPVDKTSHDIVDIVRKSLRTRKVGHAGALDPFATGVLIILVGKYTKLTDNLINVDKEYLATVVFGRATDTQDTEGKITAEDFEGVESFIDGKDMSEIKTVLAEKLVSIGSGYEQRVPVYSSVKVEGHKLRKLARQAESFKIAESKDQVTFKYKDGKTLTLELPKRKVEFSNFDIVDCRVNSEGLLEVDILVSCSKGTYIRQLAEDIGELIGLPAMLIALERTRVGDVKLSACVKLDEITLS